MKELSLTSFVCFFIFHLESCSFNFIFRCLSTSSICHSEKQVSLYKGMKSKEFIRQQEMANRQNLVDAYIQVDSPLDVTPITGVPEEHFKTRRVRIFKQAKNSMQSATFDTQNWKIGMQLSQSSF